MTEITESRIERAKQYDTRTRSQPEWYSKKATTNKRRFQFLGLSTVILGTLVVVVPLFGTAEPASITDKIIAIIGALIVILKGIERIWLPEEKWTNYRKASESLQREHEMYTECIVPYNYTQNEETAYKLYVERCLLIKAEEQNNFWRITESEKTGTDETRKHE